MFWSLFSEKKIKCCSHPLQSKVLNFIGLCRKIESGSSLSVFREETINKIYFLSEFNSACHMILLTMKKKTHLKKQLKWTLLILAGWKLDPLYLKISDWTIPFVSNRFSCYWLKCEQCRPILYCTDMHALVAKARELLYTAAGIIDFFIHECRLCFYCFYALMLYFIARIQKKKLT